MSKEYIFLFNTDETPMIKFVKNFLQDDVLIKDYGILMDGQIDNYYRSVWVTKEKYKYAYAIMESPTYDGDDPYEPLGLEDCEQWMQYQIENGAVCKGGFE